MTLWLAFSFVFRAVLSVGTVYVAWGLWKLRRDTPSMEQILRGRESIVEIAAAKTLVRFREVRLLEMALLFQAISFSFLWIGFLIDFSMFQTMNTWFSMTLAAGGTPLILTKNARIWTREALELREARQLVLDALDVPVTVTMTGLMDVVAERFGHHRAKGLALDAVRTLEKDELVNAVRPGWYRLTEHGEALLKLGQVTGTARKGTLASNNEREQ
jgi:hypothetical protein